jgi:hypothetical protein
MASQQVPQLGLPTIHSKIWDADDVLPTTVLLLVQERNEATKLLARPRANAGIIRETFATHPRYR